MALDKAARVTVLLGDDAPASAVISAYLDSAESAILNRIYPFGIPDGAMLPTRYDLLQCDLAVRYISRRGAEGQTSHDENGISRNYGTVNDEDLLSVVTPFVKVV